MSHINTIVLSAASAVLLAGCTTLSPPGPIEVTRFHDASLSDAGAKQAIFVASASDNPGDNLALGPYKQAVANELERLGYSETARSGAQSIATVSIETYRIGSNGKRGPVSVGVGGSTGSYGSGVGLGIGLNLGGGPRERVGTQMRVVLREASDGKVLWEGRASLEVDRKSALAQPQANARLIAHALFDDFPGRNGETVTVKVPKKDR